MNLSGFRPVFILFVAVLSAPASLLGQWGFDEPDPLIYIDVRAEVGIMTAENESSDRFAMMRPTFYGLHLEAGHYFDRLGVFSGIGFSVLPFRQTQSRALPQIGTEVISSRATYFSGQIPLGVGIKLGRAFSTHVALNFNFMTLINNSFEINDNLLPADVAVSLNLVDDLPTFQVVPEAIFGLDYDIGTRMRFLFFGGISLGQVQGLTHEYTAQLEGEDMEELSVDFDYRWWRFGVGLTFHIVK